MKIKHSLSCMLLIIIAFAVSCGNKKGAAAVAENLIDTVTERELEVIDNQRALAILSFSEDEFGLLEKFNGNRNGFDSAYDEMVKKHPVSSVEKFTSELSNKLDSVKPSTNGASFSNDAVNLGAWHDYGKTASYNLRAAMYFPARRTTLIVNIPLLFKKVKDQWVVLDTAASGFMLISPFKGEISVIGAPFVNISPAYHGVTRGNASGGLADKKPYVLVEKSTENGKQVTETTALNQIVAYLYNIDFVIDIAPSPDARPIVTLKGKGTFFGAGVPVK